MSERKDAEIKFRVTPTEKARWQADADKEDVSLSELIRSTMNQRSENVSLDGTSLVDNAIALLEAKLPAEHEVALTDTAVAALEAYGGLPVVLLEEMPAGMCLITNIGDAAAPQCSPGGRAMCGFPECNGGQTCSPRSAPQQDVTTDEVSGIPKEDADRLVAEGKASWMFEARDA